MKYPYSKLASGLAALFLSAASVAAAERQTLHTEVPKAAAGLPRIELLSGTTRLQFAIGLPLRNQAAMTNQLHQLYDPGSTNFHHFLTPAQFTEQFGPTEQDYQKVMNYAKSNGLEVVRTYGNRALVDVSGNVADIEGMFKIHLGVYQHPTEKRQFFAPDVEPTVVAGMPILYVSGLDNYVIPHPHGHSVRLPGGGSDPGNTNLYLGSDFRNAYVPGTTLTGSGQVVGLFELDGYTSSDIQTYETYAGLPSVPLNDVLGSNSPGSGNDEVASDIELTIAMAPGLRVVNVYEGNNNSSIINEIATPSNGEILPNQVSCSWDIEGDTSIESGLIQMAMQGQSFFYASGDSGAFPNGVNNGSEVDYRYMTGVGGTKLLMNGYGASWQSEVVWHDPPPTNFNYFSSTGGVLTQVGIPDFQQPVNMSLNNGSSVYRNVPDVALVARDIQIVYTALPANGPPVPGTYSDWVGTSAAAPLWAGLMALANQQAASQGKPPVGFLNPALYDIARGPLYNTCFHDITNGNNTWNDPSAGTGSPNLYYAVVGYDLCTGWGTPASPEFIDALVGFSGPTFVDFNYTGSPQNGTYDDPFSTMAGGVSGVATGGTIIIKTAGTSSETLTISKAMTITASDGSATIGQ